MVTHGCTFTYYTVKKKIKVFECPLVLSTKPGQHMLQFDSQTAGQMSLVCVWFDVFYGTLTQYRSYSTKGILYILLEKQW